MSLSLRDPPPGVRNWAFRLLRRTRDDVVTRPAQHTAARTLAVREAEGRSLMHRLGLAPAPNETQGRHVRPSLLCSTAARRMTLVFSGNSRVVTFPNPLLHDEHTHVMLLKDTSRRFGLAGIPGLGEDYERCLANLRRIHAELGVREVFCIGLSSGGATAMKYGCDLRAEGILGFSAPTTLDLNDDPGAELKDYPQLTLLYRHARHLGIDLAAYYAAMSPRPRLMLVYGSGHPRDSWLAERMRGIAGVELIAKTGFNDHMTYRHACDNNEVGPLIQRLFAMRAFSPAAESAGMMSRPVPVSGNPAWAP